MASPSGVSSVPHIDRRAVLLGPVGQKLGVVFIGGIQGVEQVLEIVKTDATDLVRFFLGESGNGGQKEEKNQGGGFHMEYLQAKVGNW